MSSVVPENIIGPEPVGVFRADDPAPLVVVRGTNPSAGAAFSVTNPGRRGWKLLAVTFKLVTDANVANRGVTVDYDDGNGLIFASSGIQGVVLAGTTELFSFTKNRTISEANTLGQVFAPLLSVVFEPGQKLQINVLNIQAGDQLSNVAQLYQRLPWADS